MGLEKAYRGIVIACNGAGLEAKLVITASHVGRRRIGPNLLGAAKCEFQDWVV